MDEIDSLKSLITRHIFLSVFLENIIFGLTLYLLISSTSLALGLDFAISGLVAIVFILLTAVLLSNFVVQPLIFIRQAILHISPNVASTEKAPDMKQLGIGQQLVTNLIGQIYEIAKVGYNSTLLDSKPESLSHSFIANSMPLPLFVLDKEETIKFVN